MALLFGAGAWIAPLALLVSLEKLTALQRWIARCRLIVSVGAWSIEVVIFEAIASRLLSVYESMRQMAYEVAPII